MLPRHDRFQAQAARYAEPAEPRLHTGAPNQVFNSDITYIMDRRGTTVSGNRAGSVESRSRGLVHQAAHDGGPCGGCVGVVPPQARHGEIVGTRRRRALQQFGERTNSFHAVPDST
ncbi:protein of unknown function (plasmid) [Cupriavidus taiwanensis]|uniref:Uncharacterized protein n=1 Tax=Cupriavidus taiwanensis TaxID=164546 RepID=A0A375ISU9_9BURK|nr:protein of unknown function [Cupriavidus taiwanensis]